MKMLQAIKRIRYGGKAVLPGAVFMANDADVRILLAINHAKAYVAPPQYLPPIVKTRAVVAEAEGAEGAEDRPKRAYKRRDMTAE